MMLRFHELVVWTLLAVGTSCADTASASAQSRSATGQIGYLQEWEMKASLTTTANAINTDYAGPMTLRHVGLCSVNGVEEKSGVVKLRISTRPATIEGTLAMADDECHLVASGTEHFSGLLKCRDGHDVPINLSIEPVPRAEHGSTSER